MITYNFPQRIGGLAVRRGIFLVLCLLLDGGLASSARAQKVPVIEKTLANGMKLLMVERHDEPSVAGGWVAHVGSSNERPGITGTAHLFEHMMFKGTETIGTTDYQKDLEILAAQEKVRDEMRAEEAKMRAAYRRGRLSDGEWTGGLAGAEGARAVSPRGGA